ncbi:hypothetical protein CERSUDRAFT_92109 [Gelatoporia subvermispora B]|uniref:Uncharacterized protein n=1 Tax=Ceriporiopsis subvermispora (strain B) TaxID=914234 RepID=M2R4W2_CERS8|nr:hypothetical protein CERSUDRAFT_92109 [Gelatoporia subvermispora B]
MQAGVVSTFQLDEIKRVARLFCLFEDVIDEMELGSELTIPDPDKFPPVESVRYNRVVQGIGDDEVMDAIDNAEDVPGLRTLLVPYIDHPVGLTRASTYKMKLHKHRPTTELMFNNYPTTTYGDNIVRFMEVNAKFAQYALVHDDKTIECCRPSLDVFFDDIICDGKLTQFYDPRHPRRPRPGPHTLSGRRF